MNVLGLHFGHDAAAAVLRDGHLVNCIVRERLARHKHSLGLDWATIETALRDAGLSVGDIDWVAITTTQNVEIIALDAEQIRVDYESTDAHDIPSGLVDLHRRSARPIEAFLKRDFFDRIFELKEIGKAEASPLSHVFPEYRTRDKGDFFVAGSLDDFVYAPYWPKRPDLDALAGADIVRALSGDGLRRGFHYPVMVTLDGRKLPGYYIQHHMAHAASIFYPAGLEEAAILSHDGDSRGANYDSGMYYYARDHRIFPLIPHHLIAGAIYYYVSSRLNLGPVGSEGKMMGLAPYGAPRFAMESMIGNFFDQGGRHHPPPWRRWLDFYLMASRQGGADMDAFGDRARITAPINADVAASTQRLFEDSMLRAADALHRLLARHHLTPATLCLVGGTALNCPANSRIHDEGPFGAVVVPPWCDDSGLALGAALALYHNLLGRPRVDAGPLSAYLGARIPPDAVERALERRRGEIEVEASADAAAAAAQDLADGRIVAWYEGRSEIGPRALGHRSLLADPRAQANWARVNELKKREGWRPFAPAVLAEKAGAWFDGGPLPSPHMLFTAQVTKKDVPAITHVDGSARVQTVDASCGGFRDVVAAFDRITDVPMVMNTSFNGPGEPIVESPDEALDFLVGSGLDALYLEGRRVTRRS